MNGYAIKVQRYMKPKNIKYWSQVCTQVALESFAFLRVIFKLRLRGAFLDPIVENQSRIHYALQLYVIRTLHSIYMIEYYSIYVNSSN